MTKKLQNNIFCKIFLSVVSHKTPKAFRKLSILSDFAELFPLIVLIKKHFEFHGEMTDL
jgi:hypothetical protein